MTAFIASLPPGHRGRILFGHEDLITRNCYVRHNPWLVQVRDHRGRPYTHSPHCNYRCHCTCWHNYSWRHHSHALIAACQRNSTWRVSRFDKRNGERSSSAMLDTELYRRKSQQCTRRLKLHPEDFVLLAVRYKTVQRLRSVARQHLVLEILRRRGNAH